MGDESIQMVGMAGQWVCAVMQTAGLFAQSEVLDTLSGAFISVASLLFLFSITSALFVFMVYGNFKLAGYFILGPAIFYFVLLVRIDADGTRYQFGSRVESNQLVHQKRILTNQRSDGSGEKARVSWLFARFDNVISHVIQKTVNVIIDTSKRDDIKALARDKIFQRVAFMQGGNPEYLMLLSLGVIGNCGNYLHSSLKLSHLNDLTTQRGTSVEEMIGGGSFDRDSEIAELEESIEELGNQKISLNRRLIRYLSSKKMREALDKSEQEIDKPLSCSEVWHLISAVTIVHVREELKPTNVEKEQFAVAEWDDVFKQIKSKFYANTNNHHHDSAETQIEEGKTLLLLAGYYIRNSVAHSEIGQLSSTLQTRNGQMDSFNYNFIFNDVALSNSAGYRMIIVHFAAYIPYMQGCMLYLLSTVFPFFTLVIIIPNSSSAIFTWMSFWVWIKSWDVGFAVVHNVRELTWEFTPNFGGYRTSAISGDISLSDPAAMMNLVYQSDPITHSNTNLFIISTITVLVPVVTAHFCRGATTLYSGLRYAIDDRSKSYGQDKMKAATRNEDNPTASSIDRLKDLTSRGNAIKEAIKFANQSGGMNSLDQSKQREMQLRADVAAFKGSMGHTNRMLSRALGVLTTRHMSFVTNNAQNVIQALAGDKGLREHLQRGAGTGHHLPGLASSRPGVGSSGGDATEEGKSSNVGIGTGKMSRIND